ncbi:hypothetical protein AAFC00_002707 [Neodothiora populina]|uniref:Autophagy-related protein 101 n=1 Tax=Neodothiora populina TaxID=2781224 RepID=A0ABR3P850_9PEZI
MEERQTPEYALDLFADRTNARDVARGILHLIFFHRMFASITPSTLDVLDVALPRVIDNDLDAVVDQRVNDLLRQLDHDYPQQHGGRGQIAIHFSERKRRKGWFGNTNDDELIWETWIISFTMASPRTESDTYKVRKATEKSLDNAFAKVMSIVARDTAHIPPITTNEGNPFPYSIQVKSKNEGWGRGIRVF